MTIEIIYEDEFPSRIGDVPVNTICKRICDHVIFLKTVDTTYDANTGVFRYKCVNLADGHIHAIKADTTVQILNARILLSHPKRENN